MEHLKLLYIADKYAKCKTTLEPSFTISYKV